MKKLRLNTAFAALTLAITGGSTTASAITLDLTQDFQDGLLGGWTVPRTIPNAPQVLADLGPDGDGDFALQISTNGNFSGAGSRLVGLNRDAVWTGDYTAAGVSTITVDLNSPNNVPLNARLAINGPGGRFVTDDVLVPAGTGVWDNYSFSLDPADLTAVSGGFDAALTLANVSELRLLHNPVASHRGATVGSPTPFVAFLNADNLTARGAITALTGDYSGDGFVSQSDLDLVLLNWGGDSLPDGFDTAALPSGEVFDGQLSQNELDGVLLNWGNGTPPSAAAIPEPTTAALLSLGFFGLGRRRR